MAFCAQMTSSRLWPGDPSVADRLAPETLPHDVRRGLDPVLHVQLLEGVVNVVLHGALGDRELLADLLVGQALGHELEDLELAAGDRRTLGRRRRRAALGDPVLDLAEQTPGDGRRDGGLVA